MDIALIGDVGGEDMAASRDDLPLLARLGLPTFRGARPPVLRLAFCETLAMVDQGEER